MAEEQNIKSSGWHKYEKVCGMLVFIAIVISMGEIVLRVGFNTSYDFIIQASVWLTVWGLLLIGGPVLAEDGHVSIDFILTRVTGKTKWLLVFFNTANDLDLFRGDHHRRCHAGHRAYQKRLCLSDVSSGSHVDGRDHRSDQHGCFYVFFSGTVLQGAYRIRIATSRVERQENGLIGIHQSGAGMLDVLERVATGYCVRVRVEHHRPCKQWVCL